MENYTKLEQALGYQFNNKALLKQALTHSSHTSDIHQNYERLEFLGDRILGLTIADLLCKTFQNEPEGNLSQRFVTLVCKETVAEIMTSLDVMPYIITPNHLVREQITVLCDIGEAIIAAIYQDSGKLSEAKDFVLRHWTPLIDKKSQPKKDYKTLLQEEAHRLGYPQPQYILLEKSGTEHEPLFIMEAILDNTHKQTGQGRNKKLAELQAAQNMLNLLGIHYD